MRPNIRVEIQNNLAEEESMEVEENEEGEISDNEDDQMPAIKPIKFDNNASKTVLKSNFTTGIDILDKKEQEKRKERAKRFHLNPDEIKNFTDDDLQLLHLSLGITPANDSNVRFEAIHIRGIKDATPVEIVEYFLEYAPVSIEFVCEETCNIVWLDTISATRALHFISKAVRGMPVRDDSSYFEVLQESEENDTSVLLLNKNREIELKDEDDSIVNSKKFTNSNSVDISEITTTIPPGYWRLGNKKLGKKSLLMRFSLKTDKQPYRTEQCSKYLKIQGKLGTKSDSQQGIFGRNKELFTKQKNPWSALAKNWDEDAKFREREYAPHEEEPKIEIKNPSLRVRLGEKRKNTSDNEAEEMQTNELAEPEAEVVEKPKKKVKIPRMRMYADEEEEKIKRKKMLKRLDQQFKSIEENKGTSDLRKVLNMTNRSIVKPEPEQEVFDLGAKLKNRRKMVFEIKTEMDKVQNTVKPDIRSRLSKEIEREPEREQRRRRDDTPERLPRHRVRYSDDEDRLYSSRYENSKPRSKVAVVIKTQKKPTVASAVASTVFLRGGNSHKSASSSASESDNSSAASSSSSDEAEPEQERHTSILLKRPGFDNIKDRLNKTKTPLKIEISNDHFKK